jgi:carboxypeptidase Taq
VISVQLWDRINEEIPDLEEQIERAEFGPLRDWLGERLHRYGRMFPPTELVRRAAGAPIDPGPYVAYLKRKAADVAGVAAA